MRFVEHLNRKRMFLSVIISLNKDKAAQISERVSVRTPDFNHGVDSSFDCYDEVISIPTYHDLTHLSKLTPICVFHHN